MQRDDTIILGSPEDRRRFLDFACSLDSRHYYHSLLLYRHSLRLRNHQIRNDVANERNERSLWDAVLIEHGTIICRHRAALLSELEERFTGFLDLVGVGRRRVGLPYHSCLSGDAGESLPEIFLRRLRESKRRENVFRTTVIGPHRDSFSILDNGYEMHDYCSQGEARLAVLALKLALAAHLGERRNIRPVLLFDDILIELDAGKTAGFLEALGGANQLFFTSTEVPDAPFFRRLGGEGIFTVSEGRILA